MAFQALCPKNAHFVKSGSSKPDNLFPIGNLYFVFGTDAFEALLSRLFGDTKSFADFGPAKASAPCGVDPTVKCQPTLVRY